MFSKISLRDPASPGACLKSSFNHRPFGFGVCVRNLQLGDLSLEVPTFLFPDFVFRAISCSRYFVTSQVRVELEEGAQDTFLD